MALLSIKNHSEQEAIYEWRWITKLSKSHISKQTKELTE
jgi:hypothetical protein